MLNISLVSMRKKFIHKTTLLFIFLVFFFNLQTRAFASEYVLPYPGFMPGNPLYKTQEMIDKIERFYSFGNFARFKYYLALSDKKLVEAKTLFEYKQYLFAYKALQQSSQNFDQALIFLSNAKNEGKDVSQKKELIKAAAAKHIDELKRLEGVVPETFSWQPEKEASTSLPLKASIEEAIKLREPSL